MLLRDPRSASPGGVGIGVGAGASVEIGSPSFTETARIALEALMLGGGQRYWGALRAEREIGFLSPEEMTLIPAIVRSRYLNVDTTTVQVRFQPPPGSGLPSIKDVVRDGICGAQKLLALVSPRLCDLDVLCDLLEAARWRGVSVYLLLGEHGFPAFSAACRQLAVDPLHCHNLNVRKLATPRFVATSGSFFCGRQQQRFLIIDCEHVVTGTYGYTWMDGHVNAHMITIFSGQVVVEFEEHFQELYAQSLPLERDIVAPSKTPLPERGPSNLQKQRRHLQDQKQSQQPQQQQQKEQQLQPQLRQPQQQEIQQHLPRRCCELKPNIGPERSHLNIDHRHNIGRHVQQPLRVPGNICELEEVLDGCLLSGICPPTGQCMSHFQRGPIPTDQLDVHQDLQCQQHHRRNQHNHNLLHLLDCPQSRGAQIHKRAHQLRDDLQELELCGIPWSRRCLQGRAPLDQCCGGFCRGVPARPEVACVKWRGGGGGGGDGSLSAGSNDESVYEGLWDSGFDD
ncbi:protein FAM83D-like [Lethenteron reissneri]|uniref:protein FAM83D-like n=1 Tax=Lethenteron reissneri TaxID=7753 RepID=UPI002AB75E6D|nr:protein FAM83D-like [Lethenteron reissneri]